MKIVFMGTPAFAVPTLAMLIAEHDVVAVLTQPDKPKGRGKKIRFSPIKELAQARNLPVLQPTKMTDPALADLLRVYDADVFVVAAYGRVLPKTILDMPKFGCINVHGSLLPKYRGAAPIHAAVLNSETETGVTIMLMDEGIDTGDMLLKKTMPILPTDNTGTVHDKMAKLGAQALAETLQNLDFYLANREKQDDAAATYAGLLTKEMGCIDWHKSAAEIVDLVRGLNPWPCAYTFEGENMLKIWGARRLWAADYHPGAAHHPSNGGEFGIEMVAPGRPGAIVAQTADGIVAQCGDGVVCITELQAQGGKRMSATAYLRGHDLPIGARLQSKSKIQTRIYRIGAD